MRARAAVVAVGPDAGRLDLPRAAGGTDRGWVRGPGPVLLARRGGSGSARAARLGELLAELALHGLAGAAVPA